MTTTRRTPLRSSSALKTAGFRAETFPADEPLGARVRHAKLEKVPYVLVVGDDDVAGGTVGVNARGPSGPSAALRVSQFVERLQADVAADEATDEPAG